MTDRELLQMALDALDEARDAIAGWGSYASPYFQEKHNLEGDIDDCDAVIEALRARLAQPEPEPYPDDFIDALRYHTAISEQPEQEPVAWTVRGLITDFSRDFSAYQTKTYTVPLYTAPPQREWQGLTDQEQLEIMKQFGPGQRGLFADAIEAKLKEKNA